LLKYLAELLSWISILLVLAGIIALGWFVFNYANIKYPEGDTARIYIKLCAYVIWGLAVIYFLILLCMCINIQIAIAMMKTSAIFVSHNLKTVFVPFFAFIFVGIFVIGWVIGAVCLFSVGEIIPEGGGYQYRKIEWNETTRYFVIYLIFGLFWVGCLIVAVT
jgi:hypothetical protein